MRILLLALICAAGLSAQTFERDDEGLLLAPTIAHVEALPDYGAGVNGRGWTDDHLRALARRVRQLSALDLRGNQEVSFEALLDAAYQLPACNVSLNGCRQFWPQQMNELFAAGVTPTWDVAWLPDGKIVSIEEKECRVQLLGESLPYGQGMGIFAPSELGVGAMKAFGLVYTAGGQAKLEISYTLNNASIEPGDLVAHPLWHQHRFLEWHCAGEWAHALGHFVPPEKPSPEEPAPEEDPPQPKDPGLEEREPYYEDESFESRGHAVWSPQVELILIGRNLLGDENYRRARYQYSLCTTPIAGMLAFLNAGAQRYDGAGWCHVDSDEELAAVWPATTRLRARNVTPGALAKTLPRLHSLFGLDLQGCTLDAECARQIWNRYYLQDLNLRGATVPADVAQILLARRYSDLDLSHVNGRGPQIPEDGFPAGAQAEGMLNLSSNAAVTDDQLAAIRQWAETWGDEWSLRIDISRCDKLTGSFLDGLPYDFRVEEFYAGGCTKLEARWIAVLAKILRTRRPTPVGLSDLPFKPADWIMALPLTADEDELEYPHLDLRGAKLDAVALAHLAKLNAVGIDLRRCAAATPEAIKDFKSPVWIDGARELPPPKLQFWPAPGKPYVIDGIKDQYPGLEAAQYVKIAGRPGREADDGWPRVGRLSRLVLERCDPAYISDMLTAGHTFLDVHDAEFRRHGEAFAWMYQFERMSPRAGLTLNTGVFLPTFRPASAEFRQRFADVTAAQDDEVSKRTAYDTALAEFQALEPPEKRDDFTDEERDAYEKARDKFDAAESAQEEARVRWEWSYVVLRDVAEDLGQNAQTYGERAELHSYLCLRMRVCCDALDKAARVRMAKPEDERRRSNERVAIERCWECRYMLQETELDDASSWAPNREADVAVLRAVVEQLTALNAEHDRLVKEGTLEESEGHPAAGLELELAQLLEAWRTPELRPVDLRSRDAFALNPLQLHSTSTFTLRVGAGTPREHLSRISALADYPTGLDVSGNADFDDACLAHFRSFKRLRRLNLAGSAVTLKTLRPLILKGSVRTLDLTGCKGITEKEKDALRIVFPDIEIKG